MSGLRSMGGKLASKLTHYIETDMNLQVYQIDISSSEAFSEFTNLTEEKNIQNFAEQINFCQSFNKSNLVTACAQRGDYDALKIALKYYPKHKILNMFDLYLEEGFLKVLKADNNLLENLVLDGEMKLIELFNYYKEKDELGKLMQSLDSHSINEIY